MNLENRISLLKKNRKYLKNLKFNTNSTLNIIPEKSKSEKTTAKVIANNKTVYLHSKYNPVNEAENLVNKFDATSDDIIIVLGAGLGYHIAKLREKFKNNYIILVEYNSDVFKAFLENCNEKLLQDEKIIYLIGNSMLNMIETALRYLIYIKLNKKVKIKIFKHPASLNIFSQYKAIESSILKTMSSIYSDYLTEREFKDLWERNSSRNKKYIKESKKLIELKGIYKNKSMAVIAAGPTLEHNLDFIRNNDIIKVAVDTSLRFLLHNKIKPDYVLSLDAKYENLNDFKFINTTGIKLIYDIVSFPLIPAMFKERYVTYTKKLIKTLDGDYVEYYEDYTKDILNEYGDIGGIQSGGSVATNCLDFAIFTGAKDVYFIGLDLVNINFKSHCRGTFREYYFLQRCNKFFSYHSLETINILKRAVKSYNKNGNLITEEFILNKYRQWFEDAFLLASRTGINIHIIQ